MELSEVHDCEKCRGKLVCIMADKLGNTFCSYCGQRVDYSELFKEVEKNGQGSVCIFLLYRT